jgi:carboxypeptidase D
MVPYDVPQITHDMILRFMGTNFSAITDGSARIPSSVGDDVKPIFEQGQSSPPPGNQANSPEQSKAMWEGEFAIGYDLLLMTVLNSVFSLLQRWLCRTGARPDILSYWDLYVVQGSTEKV